MKAIRQPGRRTGDFLLSLTVAPLIFIKRKKGFEPLRFEAFFASCGAHTRHLVYFMNLRNPDEGVSTTRALSRRDFL